MVVLADDEDAAPPSGAQPEADPHDTRYHRDGISPRQQCRGDALLGNTQELVDDVSCVGDALLFA